MIASSVDSRGINNSANWRTGIEVGQGTFISPLASFHGAKNIVIGKNCRIDDFVVMSAGEGRIVIGDNVHIATHVSIIGRGPITIGDGSGVSGGCKIYSSSGSMDYGNSGNPCIPGEEAVHLPVYIGQYVIVGAGSVVLPGANIGDNSIVGANGLVGNVSLPADSIFVGSPVRFLRPRR